MTALTASPKRPRPVVTPQMIVATLTFVAGQAVAFGLIPAATSSKVVSAAPIVVGAVFALVAALHGSAAVYSESRVTPREDPMALVTQPNGSQQLEPLVPLSLAVQATPNTAGIEDAPSDFSDLEPASAGEASPGSGARFEFQAQTLSQPDQSM
jgi:hypothetical protein